MTTDEQTMTDRRINTTERTGRHSSQPKEVLFFANRHFLFFKSRPTLHTLASRTSRHSNQNLPKSAILPVLHNWNIIYKFEKVYLQ